jgi:hypothetical protein
LFKIIFLPNIGGITIVIRDMEERLSRNTDHQVECQCLGRKVATPPGHSEAVG